MLVQPNACPGVSMYWVQGISRVEVCVRAGYMPSFKSVELLLHLRESTIVTGCKQSVAAPAIMPNAIVVVPAHDMCICSRDLMFKSC